MFLEYQKAVGLEEQRRIDRAIRLAADLGGVDERVLALEDLLARRLSQARLNVVLSKVSTPLQDDDIVREPDIARARTFMDNRLQWVLDTHQEIEAQLKEVARARAWVPRFRLEMSVRGLLIESDREQLDDILTAYENTLSMSLVDGTLAYEDRLGTMIDLRGFSDHEAKDAVDWQQMLSELTAKRKNQVERLMALLKRTSIIA